MRFGWGDAWHVSRHQLVFFTQSQLAEVITVYNVLHLSQGVLRGKFQSQVQTCLCLLRFHISLSFCRCSGFHKFSNFCIPEGMQTGTETLFQLISSSLEIREAEISLRPALDFPKHFPQTLTCVIALSREGLLAFLLPGPPVVFPHLFTSF